MKADQHGAGRGPRAVLVVLALAMLAGACGKVGPVRAPGPPEEITYPRAYPNR